MDNSLKFYETMFIVKPTLVEDEIKGKIDFFKDVIAKNNGQIEACLDMGMRNLAYEIKKNRRGYYYVIYFKAPASLILELERNYRINEDILRFITLKYESKKEQSAWSTLIERAKNPKAYVPKLASKERKKPTKYEKDSKKSKEEEAVLEQESLAQDREVNELSEQASDV